MLTSPIINVKLAPSTTLAAHALVLLGATGVAAMTATDSSNGLICIGSNLQDCDSSVPGRDIAAIQIPRSGSHYVIMGSGTDIAIGDLLEFDSTAGRVVKKASGTAIGQALEAGTEDGQIIRAILFGAIMA